ncbi:UDP-glycosyltransferase 74F2-like [Panicum miliaceum]|uniref:UDP-glycosyltransferase 74F2-like n=1 Tax=Panicum miliaceum TaxID=4540 RepID=A0A3L6QU82_PANMI|nr:UDP-glycosyltransferase 74F2-like [Panicum miliaceum]
MADGSEQSVHVLLLPYPSQGHINPILQFGKRLAARRGVRCTLATTRFALSQSQPATGDAVRIAAISDGCDRSGFSEAGGVDAYLSRLESAGSETLDALLRSEAEQGRPPCAVDVAYAHAFAGRIRPPLTDGETVADELPGLPAGLRPGDLPSFLAEPTSDYPAYLDLPVNQFDGLDTADHVLVNSFHELQPQELDYMASTWRAKTVGPIVPSAYLDNRLPDDTSYGFHLYTPLTATTKAWLDGRPPRSVVYTSFGSVSAPGALQMTEVAEGLYNCGKPFLWVVRASETAKIPESFAGRAKERGLIVTWSPQLEVLAHPAVGCFVTHCGCIAGKHSQLKQQGPLSEQWVGLPVRVPVAHVLACCSNSIELPLAAGQPHTRLPASSSTSRQNQYFNGLDTADGDVLPAYACCWAASRLTRRR